MEPANASPGRDDQQVMYAQTASTTPQHAGLLLEGETAGPNYQGPDGGEARPQAALPNGVPPPTVPTRRTMSDLVEMESLRYSPAASPGAAATEQGQTVVSGPAFFTEAWPAQPEPVREPRPPALPASGFSWVARLGEFLRTHVPGGVETRTTLTRQVLGQGTEGGGVMVRQEHVQHTMSQPTSPTSRQLQTLATEASMQPQTAEPPPNRDGDLPLFGPNARRVMESWMQRAPLLYPQGQTGGPGTDPGSSASIPRELVQEEVRRQVREALEGQRRSLEDLREENRLLRNEMGLRGVRAANSQQDGSGVPLAREYFDSRQGLHDGDPVVFRESPEESRGHRAYMQPGAGAVPEGHPAEVRSGPEESRGHRAFNYNQDLPGGHPPEVRASPEESRGHRAYPRQSSGTVPGGHLPEVRASPEESRGHRAYMQPSSGAVPEGHPAEVRTSPEESRGHRAYIQSGSRIVPGGHPAEVRASPAESRGHRAYMQSSTGIVPGGHPPEVRASPEESRGQYGRDDERRRSSSQGRAEGSKGWQFGQSASRPPRTSSVDRKSPLARAGLRSQSPFRLRGDADELRDSRVRGDQHGGLRLPPVDVPYRPPGFRDSRTYGDYGFEGPPSLEPKTQGPVPVEDPEGPRDRDDGRPEAGATSAPSPLDVLITGMSQLQQVLLKQKSDTIDIEGKAVTELVKLPEYTVETGAIDFQDYLYLAEQQIATLAAGASEWWAQTLKVAQAAYAEYQTLSPVKRLNVVARLTPELQEPKYQKLERKVVSLVLASLPKGVRDDLVAYRVQGVHQILYRLMVIFQPGGAQDRAQLLKQLDVNETSQGPGEAIIAIRRWYRLLQRARDLGVTLPDESLQVKSLSMIVKRTAEQNADFKFRLALARTELQVDTRPTQDNVYRYLQHLLAELEQLGAITRRQTAATTATSPSSATSATVGNVGAGPGGTTLKGLQPTSEAKAKAKASPSSPAKKPCQWFSSDVGCRNGKACTFTHTWTGLNRGERCLLCGSKQHRAKECPTGQSTAPPEKTVRPPQVARVQAETSSTTTPSPMATAAPEGSKHGSSSTGPSVPATETVGGGASNKIDAARVTEILSETNKMLKALATPATTATASSSAPLDPIEMIQKQLDEVRRLKTLVVRESDEGDPAFSSALSWFEARLNATMLRQGGGDQEGEALLDSGASHAFRPPASQEELTMARRVGVSLATGEERSIPQNSGGTLLGEDGGDSTILPMGQLVTLLGCRVTWTPSKLVVIHPAHGKLQVRLRGHCPVLPVTQALSLISELEQKRMESFERTVQDLQLQVKTLKEKGMQGWTWGATLTGPTRAGRSHAFSWFPPQEPRLLHGEGRNPVGYPRGYPP